MSEDIIRDDESVFENEEIDRILREQKYNKELFKESYLHYRRILKKYADVAKEINLENSLQICMFYTYLLWNGYFSKTKKNMYTDKDIATIEGLYGFDLMRGKGVCLHHSAMLRDFLIQCGYDSAILINKRDNKVQIDKFPEIKKRYGKMKSISFINFLKKFIFSNEDWNHSFNLVRDGKDIYAYDATNISLLKIRNINLASVINGKGNCDLKPYISIGANLPKKSRDLLKSFCEQDKFPIVSSKRYFIETFKSLIEFLNKHKYIIDEVYNSVKEDIDFITGTVKTEVNKKR